MSPKIVVDLVESMREEMGATQACAWLGVSRATYYRWKAAYEIVQWDNMVEKIRNLCLQHKFRYGYRKITALFEQTVRDYIHYYNAIRIQTKLNNQSPIDFRRLVA